MLSMCRLLGSHLSFLAVIFLLCSCSGPIKGYPGPTRPAEELSVITWKREGISDMVLDDEHFDRDYSTWDIWHQRDRGVSVLPGAHRFSFQGSVRVYSPPPCLLDTREVVSTDYNRCSQEKIEASKCDIKKEEISHICRVPIYIAQCEGEFNTLPGRKYTIDSYNLGSLVFYYRVDDDKSPVSIVHQKCADSKESSTIEVKTCDSWPCLSPCGGKCH